MSKMGSADDILCSIIQNGWTVKFCLEEYLQYLPLNLDGPPVHGLESLESYLDMVLLTSGSPFTVGEASLPSTQLKSAS